ncbi:hypothetical protein SprV_0301027900 [Sparganum proliferum]
MPQKTGEIQGYTENNDSENFFAATKATHGAPTKGTASLLTSDGLTLLTELYILKHWAEHFGNVLNRPSAISDAAIDRLPQVEANTGRDLPPSIPETIRAVQQLSLGKAPGSDEIPAEIYKHRGHRMMDQFATSFRMWRCEQLP